MQGGGSLDPMRFTRGLIVLGKAGRYIVYLIVLLGYGALLPSPLYIQS